MSRRIDVELTSDRGDGTWSWRAAGARQPKGVVDASLLYDDAQVGDVVRAEADFDIEGITITAVQAPKSARREPERIEIIGVEREFSPVTSSLTGKARERAEQGHDERPRRGRDDRGPRPSGRPGGPGRDGARGPRPGGERPSRPPRERPAPPPPRPKPKKLRPARVHRDAFLAALAPEQQPIAEQLLRGGMPAVRTALAEQNAKAQAEGGLEIPTTTVLGIAEQLVSAARVADWLDRAEAARATGDELALRDLRSVVSSADDVARDETTRELAAELKATLEQRTEEEQRTWLSDIEQSLTGGRVVRALRLSSRPPEPGTSFPEELMTRLTEAASRALTDDIASDRWATVLDAVAYSPARRSVTPAGIPAEPTEALLAAVRKHAGRAPAIAAMFGIGAPESSKSSKRPSKAAGRNPNVSRTGGLRNAAVPVPGRPGGPPVPPARRIPPPPGRQIGATLPGSAPVPPAPAPSDPTTPLAPASATGTDEGAATTGSPEAAPAALHPTDAPADASAQAPDAARADGPVTGSAAAPTEAGDVAPEAAAEAPEAALVLDAAPNLPDAPSPATGPVDSSTAESVATDRPDATASEVQGDVTDLSTQASTTSDEAEPATAEARDAGLSDGTSAELLAAPAAGDAPAPDTALPPEAATAPTVDGEVERPSAGEAGAVLSGQTSSDPSAPEGTTSAPATADPVPPGETRTDLRADPADGTGSTPDAASSLEEAAATAPSPGDEAASLTAGAADAVLSGEMGTDPLAAPAEEAVPAPDSAPSRVTTPGDEALPLTADGAVPTGGMLTDPLAAPAVEAALPPTASLQEVSDGAEVATTPGAGDQVADAGSTDAGSPDTGPTDRGSPDTDSPDAGSPDTGSPGTRSADTSSPDAGSADAGTGGGSPPSDASADEEAPARSAPADSSLPEPSPAGDVDGGTGSGSGPPAASEQAGAERDAMVSQAAGGPFEPPADAPVEQAPNSAVGPVHVAPPEHDDAPADQEDRAG